MTRGEEARKRGGGRSGPVGFGAGARQREIGRPETPRVRRVSGVWLAMAGLAAGSERTRRGRGDGVGARCARRTPWVRVGLMRGWFGRGRTHHAVAPILATVRHKIGIGTTQKLRLSG